ncbi:MAG: hypothetical protein JW709_08870 [Sedimentisphaerales bacterium]|nr:hypothetical protein [Sedimentisphaerales bacterium]
MSMLFSSSGFYNLVHSLSNLGTQLAMSNMRLSTGHRINSGADDPAGIIAVANFDNEIAQLEAATRNGERINSIIDTADGAMSQIQSLLGTIQSKALSASGSTVTAEEKAAYQAEIDAAVDSIDRLVNTTTFNGTRLLDGGLSYTTSGVDNAKLADIRVHSADTSAGDITLAVSVVSAAEKAEISYDDGVLLDDVTFTLTGENGSEEFSFASGTSIETIAAAVNAASDTTGVEAEVDTDLFFRSVEYGEDKSVSINVTSGTFAMVDGTSDDGVDATVTVNGQATIADGLNVSYSASNVSVSFTLKESFGSVGGGSESFTVTGGGTNWALTPASSYAIDYGMGSLGSSSLGTDELGYLASLKSGGVNALSSGNYHQAANIASKASLQVATERARIGAIKSYSVETTLSSLATTKTALQGARSSIMDIDYAEETAINSRLQVLTQATTSLLAMFNQNTSTMLSILMR